MKVAKTAKGTFILMAVINFILGLCLIIWPHTSAVTICFILGAILAIMGIVNTICYFRGDVFGLPVFSGLAFGILNLVLGLILLIHPGGAIALLPIIIGIVIIIDSVLRIQTAIDVKRAGVGGWWKILLFAALTTALGILLVVNPFAGAKALMILIGITLILDAIQNIWVVVYVSKYLKEHVETDTYYTVK